MFSGYFASMGVYVIAVMIVVFIVFAMLFAYDVEKTLNQDTRLFILAIVNICLYVFAFLGLGGGIMVLVINFTIHGIIKRYLNKKIPYPQHTTFVYELADNEDVNPLEYGDFHSPAEENKQIVVKQTKPFTPLKVFLFVFIVMCILAIVLFFFPAIKTFFSSSNSSSWWYDDWSNSQESYKTIEDLGSSDAGQ